MGKFTLKLFSYIAGELCVVVKEFERIEDAIAHGIAAAVHSYRVFDEDGFCCHDGDHHHHPMPYC